MGKISEIMLLKQPKQSALAVEVQTDMNGMSEAIGKNFVKIDSLFKEQGEVTTDIPYVEYPNFESLTEHNIKMIIATSSDKTHIKKAFERLGILKYFTDIVTCSQIGKGKTSPDIYLACADKLGTAPSETLVFEDAVFAAETAHKAGFKTVGVYDESSRNDKNRIKAVCDYYADSFEKAADWGHHLLSL